MSSFSQAHITAILADKPPEDISQINSALKSCKIKRLHQVRFFTERFITNYAFVSCKYKKTKNTRYIKYFSFKENLHTT